MNEDLTNQTPVMSMGQMQQNAQLSMSDLVDQNKQLSREVAVQEVQENPFSNLISGALGFGSGATLGAFPQALEKLGIVDQDKLWALKEENPASFFTGEMLSFVAPGTPLTKGAGLLSKSLKTATSPIQTVAKLGNTIQEATTKKLIQKASEGSVKKALAKATDAGLGSAVEGAFFGAGQVITDDALGDVEANAEVFLNQVGLSALIGGGFGAAFNAAGQGLRSFSKNYKSLAREGFKKASMLDDETIDYVAQDETYRKLVDIQKRPGSVEEKAEAFLGDTFSLFDDKADEFTTFYSKGLDDVLKEFRLDGQSVPLSKLRNVIRKGIRQLEQSGTAGPAAKSAIKQLRDYEEQLIELSISNIRKSAMGKTLQTLLKDFKGNKSEQANLLRKIAGRRDLSGELRLTADQIAGISKAANVEARNKNLYNFMAETRPGAFQWSAIGDEARSLMDNFTGTGGDRLRALNSDYKAFKEATKELKKFGLSKGATQTEAVPRLEKLFKGTSKTAKNAKKHLEQLDSVLGTDLAERQKLLSAYFKITDNRLAPMLTGYSTFLPAISAVTGMSLGLPTPIVGGLTLATAAVQSPSLRGPIIRAATKVAPKVDRSLAFVDEAGQAVPEYLMPFIAAKIAGMAEVERKVKSFESEVTKSTKDFMQKGSIPNVAQPQKQPFNFQEVQKLISDPLLFDKWFDEQMRDIGLVYPSIKEPMKYRVKNKMQFLVDEQPGQVDPNDLFNDTPPPSDQQQQEFEDKQNLINDPKVIFAILNENRVTQTHVAILERFAPIALNKIREQIIENLEDAKERGITYAQQQQLSVLLGQPLSSPLMHQRFINLQQSFSPQNRDVQMPSQNDLKGYSDIAKQTLSPGQRVQEN